MKTDRKVKGTDEAVDVKDKDELDVEGVDEKSRDRETGIPEFPKDECATIIHESLSSN